ncbi:hypothetical protein ZWY2020_048847 [Hordeum vulgare]|nr:hypothetical protein ZWY2020_048847 [Hordeum vulgare]
MAARSRSPESVSSAFPRPRPVVAGLGLSGSPSARSSSNRPESARSPAAGPAVPGAAAGWNRAKASRKALSRPRKAQRRVQAQPRPPSSSSSKRSQTPCHHCFRAGHRKQDCTFPSLCIHYNLEGHSSGQCKRPRNPASIEELRRAAAAKVARMETGSPPAFGVGRVPLDPWKNALSASPARFSPSVPVARPAPHLLPVGMPGENFCVLRRSQVMDDMEARLRLAAVVYFGGARPPVSCVEAAEAIAAQLNIPRHSFSVHHFHPEDFLIVFATPEFSNSATGAGSMVHQGFELFFRPWIRQAQATARVMRVLVDIMIEAIPYHAWEWETADKILGSSCDIISLAPETASREDLSLFKLRSWCRDPNLVPLEKCLWIPEPVEEAGLPAAHQQACCQLLEYPTLVHIGRMRDFTPPENWRRPTSSDGSGQSGLPDDSFVGGELQVCPGREACATPAGPRGWSATPPALERAGPMHRLWWAEWDRPAGVCRP